MKTRVGFVSNSSSSSFILRIPECIDPKISCEDIRNCLSCVIENSSDLKQKKDFIVLNLKDESQRRHLVKIFGRMLNDWNANMSHREGSKIVQGPPDNLWWDFSLQKLKNRDFNGFHTWICISSCTTIHELMKDCRDNKIMYRYDRKKDKDIYLKTPRFIRDFLRKNWKKSKMATNFEVAMDKDSWLFIHFNENDIYRIKGMWNQDYKKIEFESDEATAERFFEIIFRKLKEKKIIDKEETDYLKFMEDSLRTFCIHEG